MVFQLIQRYALHLPELKYKKNTLKKIQDAKDLLTCMRLLCFVNKSNLDNLYMKKKI